MLRKGHQFKVKSKVIPHKSLEECVLCHRVLEMPKSVDVSERLYYVEGARQLCRECYMELYGCNVVISE